MSRTNQAPVHRPDVSVGLNGSLAVASPPLPQYSHHAVIIGATILLVTIAVIATVTLLIIWGRRGR
jgi:hypothetical protein